MGQKIAPPSLRLNINKYFNSCWYADRLYSSNFHDDLIIYKYLQSIFNLIGSKTALSHTQVSFSKVSVYTVFCDPRSFNERLRNKLFNLSLTPFFRDSLKSHAKPHHGFKESITKEYYPFVFDNSALFNVGKKHGLFMYFLLTLHLLEKKGIHYKDLNDDFANGSFEFFLFSLLYSRKILLTELSNKKSLKATNMSDTKNAQSLDFYSEHVQSVLSHYLKTQVNWVPVKVNSFYSNAQFLANQIALNFEQNKSFKQIFKKILKEVKKEKNIIGLRISCAGRLGGAEMARVESKRYGRTSLHVFSNKIDYSTAAAYTTYGLIGIKVWISFK